MDPFSIVATALGLAGTGLSLAKQIHDFAAGFKEAPADVAIISADLKNINLVLAQIAVALKELSECDIKLPQDIHSDISAIISDCQKIFGGMKELLEEYDKVQASVWQKTKWLLFGEEDAGKLARRIGASKLSLGIALQLVNILATTDTNKDTKEIILTLQILKKMLDTPHTTEAQLPAETQASLKMSVRSAEASKQNGNGKAPLAASAKNGSKPQSDNEARTETKNGGKEDGKHVKFADTAPDKKADQTAAASNQKSDAATGAKVLDEFDALLDAMAKTLKKTKQEFTNLQSKTSEELSKSNERHLNSGYLKGRLKGVRITASKLDGAMKKSAEKGYISAAAVPLSNCKQTLGMLEETLCKLQLEARRFDGALKRYDKLPARAATKQDGKFDAEPKAKKPTHKQGDKADAKPQAKNQTEKRDSKAKQKPAPKSSKPPDEMAKSTQGDKAHIKQPPKPPK